MSQSFNLYQLQRIDTKMDQLRQRVEKANVAIKDHKEIDTLQENLHSLEKTRDELLDHIGSVDAEIQSKKIKINQSESSLYGGKVQNPKELQALQAEIASLTNFVTAKEKELSVLMQEFESMEIQVDKARTTLEDGVALKQKNDQKTFRGEPCQLEGSGETRFRTAARSLADQTTAFGDLRGDQKKEKEYCRHHCRG